MEQQPFNPSYFNQVKNFGRCVLKGVLQGIQDVGEIRAATNPGLYPRQSSFPEEIQSRWRAFEQQQNQ